MSVTVLHMPYKSSREPLVRIGEYLAIPLRSSVVYALVDFIDPIQRKRLLVDVVPPAAPNQPLGGPVTLKVSDHFELGVGQLGQVWIEPLDPVFIAVPKPYRRYEVKDEQTRISPAEALKPQFTELYVYGDEVVPVLDVYNPFFTELRNVRIDVYGFRYDLIVTCVEEIGRRSECPRKPENYTVVPIVPGHALFRGVERA